MRCPRPIGTALLIAVFAQFFASACTGDLSLPAGVSYACSPSQQCPAGYVCRESDGRCMESDSEDTTPPALSGEPTLTPPTATVGVVLTASFAVNEELGRAPEVELRAPGGKSLFALDAEASDAQDYSFVYRPSGAELSVLEEAEATVTVTLVDLFGNVAKDLPLGTVVLDTRPPRLAAAPLLVGTLLAAGSTATLTFSASESLAEGGAIVQFDDGLAWAEGEASGDDLVFSYTADGTEPEGCRAVTVALQDLAGNASGPVPAGAVCFDFTPPAVRRVAILPTQVKPGQYMLLELAVSEPLAGRPILESDPAGIGFSGVGTDPNVQIFAWERRATDQDPVGPFTLAVTVQDQAGNQTRVNSVVSGTIVAGP